MSILNKISKLIKLSERIDVLSHKSADLSSAKIELLEKNYEKILKSTGLALSPHVHHVSMTDELGIRAQNKTDITFQFSNELSSVFEEKEEPMLLATPPQSPVKSGAGTKSSPPSPSKLKSPMKLPSKPLTLQLFTEDLVNSREELTEASLHEARSIEYLERVIKLGQKVKSLIAELQNKVKDNKSKMIGSFKTLMTQNNLPYVEEHATQLLGELFDIVHRDEGTFEQLAKNLSKGFAVKLKEQNYPAILDLLKQNIKALLVDATTETNESIQKAFRQIIETEHNLTYNDSFYDLFKTESSGFLHDSDLDFHADRFVELFSARLMAFNILDVRNKIVQQNPTLFNTLGKVDVRPENYFELTKESKQLGQHFIQTLYDSPERVDVLLHFQQLKEKTIKSDMIDYVLSFRSEVYNQELLYIEREKERVYLQSAVNIQDFNEIKLVSWDEIKENIKSIFKNRNQHLAVNHDLVANLGDEKVDKILAYAKSSYDKIARTFASIPSAGEQNTCISFFPIQFESRPSGKLEHVCLVTTSGAVNKLDPNNKENVQALLAFQEMIKVFAQKSMPLVIDGQPYTFMYHDEEKGAIDVLLQQLNKGFSGTQAPLSSFAPESELVLNDPFRGCAEKKFIDFVRCQLTHPLDSKKMTILGAANLRMPIVPKKEHSACLNQSLVKLYETCLNFYKTNVDIKKIGEFETASFIQHVKNLLNTPDLKTIKSSKDHLAAWKKRTQSCVTLIETSKTTQLISDSKSGLNQLLVEISVKLNPNGSKDVDQIYLHQEAELIKGMIAYFSWQERVMQLKEQLSIMQEKDGVQLSCYSATLGKIYDIAKSRLNNFFLDKINTKGGVQKLYDHCLENYEELTITPDIKGEIKHRVNKHCSNMTALYTECLKFLNARQLLLDMKVPAESLQKDIDQLGLLIKKWQVETKLNLEGLAKISISTKRSEGLKKEFESALKAINTGLQFIDQSGKPFFATNKMIEKYTESLNEAQKVEQDQYICASIIPVTVNYNNQETATFETNYIDCCCACTANKLPVLTWLTDLQKEKQQKLANFECEPFCSLGFHPIPQKKVLFSNFGFGHSTAFASPTGLSPLVRSLELKDTNEEEVQQQNTTGQPRVARKLFD